MLGTPDIEIAPLGALCQALQDNAFVPPCEGGSIERVRLVQLFIRPGISLPFFMVTWKCPDGRTVERPGVGIPLLPLGPSLVPYPFLPIFSEETDTMHITSSLHSSRPSEGILLPRAGHYLGRLTIAGEGMTANFRMVEGQDGSIAFIGSAIDSQTHTRSVETFSMDGNYGTAGEFDAMIGRLQPKTELSVENIVGTEAGTVLRFEDIHAVAFTEFDPRSGAGPGATFLVRSGRRNYTAHLTDYREGLGLTTLIIGGVVVIAVAYIGYKIVEKVVDRGAEVNIDTNTKTKDGTENETTVKIGPGSKPATAGSAVTPVPPVSTPAPPGN